MHIAECGSGPLVLLCHGFPESWYSWRHQLQALAEAGFRAVAPDMRGYGQTDRPEAIEQYTLLHLVGDMVGLLDALGADTAAIAGHDWGAPVAWHSALLRPDRFSAVIGLSVPFWPRSPVRPTSLMPQTDDALFYQLIFRLPVSQRRNSSVTLRAASGVCSIPPPAIPRTGKTRPATRSAWYRARAVFFRAWRSLRRFLHGSPKRT